MSTAKLYRFTCPGCGVSEIVHSEKAAKNLQCRCGAAFIPLEIGAKPITEADHVTARARNCQALAWLAIVLGIVAACVAGVGYGSGSANWLPVALAGSGLVSTGITLAFFAQLLHIRAAILRSHEP